MEQARERAVEWKKAAGAAVVVVVLQRDREGTVSVPNAVKRWPIKWELPVIIRNVLNVEAL